MRTLTAGQIGAVGLVGVDRHNFLSIEWPLGGELFYSERATSGAPGGVAAWTPSAAYTFEPILVASPESTAAAELDLDVVGQFRTASFALVADPASSTPLLARVSGDPPFNALVRCYHVYRPVGGGNPSSADWILDGEWRIGSFALSETQVVFTLHDSFRVLADSYPWMGWISRSTALFVDAPDAVLGRTVPRIWGALSGVPAIPINAPRSGTLAATLASNADVAYLAEDLTAWEATGLLRIDSELASYTAKAAGGAVWTLTGLVRGAYGTTACEHAQGSVVKRVLTGEKGYKFLICGHAATISAVYADGALVDAALWAYLASATSTTLALDWRLPSRLSGTSFLSRILNDTGSDPGVPQANWSLDPASNASATVSACDGSPVTYAQLIGGQWLAAVLNQNYSALQGKVDLRKLELRVLYRGMTSVANVWPSASPTIQATSGGASAGQNVLRPLDMQGLANLYPQTNSGLDSRNLFTRTGGNAGVETPMSWDAGDMVNAGGSRDNFMNMYATSTFSPQTLYLHAWHNMSGVAYGAPLPVIIGKCCMVSGGSWPINTPFQSGRLIDSGTENLVDSFPKLKFRIDPALAPGGSTVTYKDIVVTVWAQAFSDSWTSQLDIHGPVMDRKMAVEMYAGGVSRSNAITFFTPGLASCVVTFPGTISAASLQNCLVSVYPYNATWPAVNDFPSCYVNGAWEVTAITITATQVAATATNLTFTGDTVPLLSSNLIPSAQIEQRIDLLAAGFSWASLTPSLRVLVNFPDHDGTVALWVYGITLYAEYVLSQFESPDVSERAITVDVVGRGGAGLTAAGAVTDILTAADMCAVAGARYDSTALSAALSASGAGGWLAARYLDRTASKMALLAEVCQTAGIRFAFDGGRVRFFSSVLAREAETAVAAVTPDQMTALLAIEGGSLDLIANRVRIEYAPAYDTGLASASAMAENVNAQVGAIGVRERQVQRPWLWRAADAAALAAWLVADFALLRLVYKTLCVSHLVEAVEVGDVVTVADAFMGVAATRARVMTASRGPGGERTALSCASGLFVIEIPEMDELILAEDVASGSSVYVQRSTALMFWKVAGVIVAKLDQNGNLFLKGRVKEAAASGDSQGTLLVWAPEEDALGAWALAVRQFSTASPETELFLRRAWVDHAGNFHVGPGGIHEVGMEMPGFCATMHLTDLASNYLTWGRDHDLAIQGGDWTTTATYLGTFIGAPAPVVYVARLNYEAETNVRFHCRKVYEDAL